ncbi:DUF4870 domain-containing protein [Ammoniphilus sp. CFH 90114]|uniref:DUF4870 domain-containing protein n=1 Tax=Ammoniphilus sp. CFH 90114 TaxID=2493665 RepID=UPI00100E550B|nr:DUF4870 domain-containing protein [Ammoniphilus sp. CFH 90114]RXT15520.1 DUF4870 domain-containing protein [Ammoniphilus sp. CFH 90114]
MDRKASLIVIHASAFFAPILVPLIFMFITKDHEVKDFAIQALLFHILLSFCIFISFVLSFVLIGMPLLVFFGIVGVWYPIKGIIYAAQERPYGYPIVAKWVM